MSSALALPFTTWSVGRRVAAGGFVAATVTALACAAIYVSGVLFLLINKADPRQASWTSIVGYWQLYAEDAVLRQRLLTAMALSGMGLLVVLPGALFAAARPRRPGRSARRAPARATPGIATSASAALMSPPEITGRMPAS